VDGGGGGQIGEHARGILELLPRCETSGILGSPCWRPETTGPYYAGGAGARLLWESGAPSSSGSGWSSSVETGAPG